MDILVGIPAQYEIIAVSPAAKDTSRKSANFELQGDQ